MAAINVTAASPSAAHVQRFASSVMSSRPGQAVTPIRINSRISNDPCTPTPSSPLAASNGTHARSRACQASIQDSGTSAVAIVADSGDHRRFVITFSGSGIVGGSLPDGRYTLGVKSDSVHDGFGQALTGPDRVFSLHRLFGDSDGDRDVDAVDVNAFKTAMTSSPANRWWFDYDNSGQLDATDLLQLRLRTQRLLY